MNGFSWIAELILGYVWQWMRAPKKFPNWASYAIGAVTAALLWWWLTPNAAEIAQADWRSMVGYILTFFLAARGSAAFVKDVKAAPGTNTL